MCRKFTTEEFIEKAKEVHFNKYDYSKVEYVNTQSKVMIVCEKHGVFEQSPNSHLQGFGCKECGIEKKTSNTEQFILKAKSVHGDKYDYSKVEYKGTNSKVMIICEKHGVFEQSPNSHLRGRGCKECYSEKRTLTTEEFILKAKSVHGDKYDYSKVEYVDIKKDIIIICKEHGEFKQRGDNHLSKRGCNKCGNIKIGESLAFNKELFVEKAKEVHGDKYDYSKVIYINARTKVKIICKKHGVFKQTSDSHLQGAGCPSCQNSKGETKISNFLTKNNIIFEEQKRFDDCKNKNTLPFDFYIPKWNLLIEYDGEQHFKPVSIFGGKKGYENCKINDNIKNEYCKNNNIPLVRIPYTEYENIEDILDIIIKTYNKKVA